MTLLFNTQAHVQNSRNLLCLWVCDGGVVARLPARKFINRRRLKVSNFRVKSVSAAAVPVPSESVR